MSWKLTLGKAFAIGAASGVAKMGAAAAASKAIQSWRRLRLR